MASFEEAQQQIRAFVEERDWDQFHSPKDLAISISLEAAELLEVFQWSGADLEATQKREHLCEELADVMIYCCQLADKIGVSPADAMIAKLKKAGEKYPVEKSFGSSKKYTEL